MAYQIKVIAIGNLNSMSEIEQLLQHQATAESYYLIRLVINTVPCSNLLFNARFPHNNNYNK